MIHSRKPTACERRGNASDHQLAARLCFPKCAADALRLFNGERASVETWRTSSSTYMFQKLVDFTTSVPKIKKKPKTIPEITLLLIFNLHKTNDKKR